MLMGGVVGDFLWLAVLWKDIWYLLKPDPVISKADLGGSTQRRVTLDKTDSIAKKCK